MVFQEDHSPFRRLVWRMDRFSPADGRALRDPESPSALVVLVPTPPLRRRLWQLAEAAQQAWSCVEVRECRRSHYIE